MAHAIIFTDRAPRNWIFDNTDFHRAYLTYPAGAYKIASVLRAQGLDVLVVPNSLHFSLKGIKHIVESNSKGLLWVGISSTLQAIKSNSFEDYRDSWAHSDQEIIGVDGLFKKSKTYAGRTEMPWSEAELYLLSEYLDQRFNVPLLIGGSYVSGFKENGNLRKLHDNCHVVSGNAEKYIEDFTRERLKNPTHVPPYVCNNGDYDDVGFRTSKILWNHNDFVTPDSVLPLEISRGCAFNCAYCSYDRKSMFDTYKDPEILRQELIYNYEKFGVTQYMLIDDLYNDSKKKVRELYDRVWSRLPFKPEWSGYMRLDLLWNDPESAEIIKASGARLGSFGIETLHEKAGRSVGKGLGRRRIIESLEHLKKTWGNDVLVSAYFIAGLPHEPLDSIKESMEWSITTDLLYSADWKPLWVTPPDHMAILDPSKTHQISNDNEKYGIRWVTPSIWENSVGVRFDQVDQMCSDIMHKIPHGFRVTFADYSDMRASGLTHEQICNLKTDPNFVEIMHKASNRIKHEVDARLQKILSLHD